MKPVSFLRKSWKKKDAKASRLRSGSSLSSSPSADPYAKSFFDSDDELSDSHNTGMTQHSSPKRPLPPPEALHLSVPPKKIDRSTKGPPIEEAENAAVTAAATLPSQAHFRRKQPPSGQPGDSQYLRRRPEHHGTMSLSSDYAGSVPGIPAGLAPSGTPPTPTSGSSGSAPTRHQFKAERSMQDLSTSKSGIEEVRHEPDSLTTEDAENDAQLRRRRTAVDRSKKQWMPRRHRADTLSALHSREYSASSPPDSSLAVLSSPTRVDTVIAHAESCSLPYIHEGSDSSCSTALVSPTSSSCTELDICPFPLSLFPAPPSLKLAIDYPAPHHSTSLHFSHGPSTPDSSPLWTPISPKFVVDVEKHATHGNPRSDGRAIARAQGLRNAASTSSLHMTRPLALGKAHRSTASDIGHEQVPHPPPGLGHGTARMASISGPELLAPYHSKGSTAPPSSFRYNSDNSEVATKEPVVIQWGYAV